eukprot:TRINITY_DN28019_c0_g1_i1.p1 TRINITY_DN28019_c0_g1~~TRINITY_DN28019_c0_g1_i1.p1  ORF type:complete len:579 (+),score=218.99 TRINITY_DN28019_c0_g1_i1:72-1808(+)
MEPLSEEEETKLEVALADSPAVEIEYEEDGEVRAPPCLEAFFVRGTTAAVKCVTLRSVRTCMARAVLSMCDCEFTDGDARTHYAGCCTQVRAADAMLAALGQTAQRQADGVEKFRAELMTALQSQEGETDEERMHAFSLKQCEEALEKNPFFAREREQIAKYCRLCADYSPADTTNKERLDEFIAGKGGPDQLARGIAAMQWGRFADQRDMFVDLLKECVREKWSEATGAVFLLTAFLASQSSDAERTAVAEGMVAMKTSAKNLWEVQEIVGDRIEEITAALGEVERELRESGEFEKLGAVGADVVPDAGGVRQDRPDVLGSHPEYTALKDEFAAAPLAHKHITDSDTVVTDGFYPISNAVINSFDPDFRPLVRGYIKMQEDAQETARRAGGQTMDFGQPTVQFQPYLMWLLTVARKVNTPFQRKVHSLLQSHYQGDPEKAKIKAFKRCAEKQREDYKHTDYPLPSGAQMVDMVRCLLVCSTAAEVSDVFETIRANFRVLRVKNTFAVDEVQFGFRQIILNVLFQDEDNEDLRMVCEIQINLEQYTHVKHQIHKFYSIVRCVDPHELMSVMTKQAMLY